MSGRIKLGKMAIVIFITVLVWVWADLAQDDRLTLTNDVVIAIGKSSDPSLWVCFTEEPSALKYRVIIGDVVLKGPASRIAEASRMKNEGTLDLEIFLVPEQQGMTEPGNPALPVLNFLRQSEKIKQLGLSVESCEPKTLSVQVARLVEKLLTVVCVDEAGVPRKAESIDPPKVSAYVPEGWGGEKLVAKAQMTQREINQARTTPVDKTTYIVLPGDQTRNITTTVNVKMPPVEDVLREYPIRPARLGYCLSENLQGKYEVRLEDAPGMTTVLIKATPAAKQAYENQPFQMLLYIYDDDMKSTEVQSRPVVFNFPQDFVRNDEIVQSQEPPTARFSLVALPGGTSASSGK
ncbi:MAG: hypothetical protein JSU70_20445 [Phycisphaerales bacterium]|nr:MAG: hypothetical protein JSU70_20445 [Phycisphaerales bacterium]